MIIGLISCCKLKNTSKCKAKDMYISPWFKKGYEYLSNRCDKIYIMSAKYGLLSTETIISPYQQTLLKMNKHQRKRWSYELLQDLKKTTDLFNDTFIILGGGKIYRIYLSKDT